jgi:hypothetical protein
LGVERPSFFMDKYYRRDSNPFKSSVRPIFWRRQMAIHPNPDRDVSYMKQMWGTTKLVTDYVPIVNKNKRTYRVDYCEYFEDTSK